MTIWLALLFFFLLPVSTDVARRGCRTDIAGITYCGEDGGQTHLLIVDLSNPYVRVQTVMAHDVLDVWPPDEQRESVADMAQRYRDDGVVIAINGDYFGEGRGPEGPTVVQGQRLDTPTTIALNPSHYRRTTLAVSRSGSAAIVHLNPISFLAPVVYRDVLFNAISGGPIILLDGQPLPEDLSCFLDRIPVNTCRRGRQTAAGVDASGQTLYLAVSTERSTRGMAELLRDYGASTALKLDAGGSSQLWYRGRMLVKSDREIANALLVFHEDRPRHAAELVARPPVLLLSVGDQTTINIPVRNNGYLAWTFDRYYGLHRLSGASLSGDFARLLDDVPPDQVGAVSLPVRAGHYPGVYSSVWRMALPSEEFGPNVPIQVVVIPCTADDLQRDIQTELNRLAALNDRRFEREWPQTAEKLRRMIVVWVKAHPGESKTCFE